MYAVIRTGGKQYRVAEGDTIEVEHLPVKGNKVTFSPVLVVTDDGKTIYGRKELKPFTVTAKVLGESKGDKIDVFKYRAKTGYAAHQGHRQLYSMIEITSIGSRDKAPAAGAQGSEGAAGEAAAERAGTEPSETREAEPEAGSREPA